MHSCTFGPRLSRYFCSSNKVKLTQQEQPIPLAVAVNPAPDNATIDAANAGENQPARRYSTTRQICHYIGALGSTCMLSAATVGLLVGGLSLGEAAATFILGALSLSPTGLIVLSSLLLLLSCYLLYKTASEIFSHKKQTV